MGKSLAGVMDISAPRVEEEGEHEDVSISYRPAE
jgi:hypothetical protein